MPTRTVYSLSSSVDGVVVYVGSTAGKLDVRLKGHFSMATRSDAPVCIWIRATRDAGHRVVIRPLIRRAGVEAERTEIARRVALGEPLLNVADGGACPQTRRAGGGRVDSERHSSSGDGAVPEGFHPVAESRGAAEHARWLIVDSLRAIKPREPRHPNAWRDSRAALAPSPQLADVAA